MESDLILIRGILDDPNKRNRLFSLVNKDYFVRANSKFLFRMVKEISGAIEECKPINLDLLVAHINRTTENTKEVDEAVVSIGKLASHGSISSGEFDYAINTLVKDKKYQILSKDLYNAVEAIGKGNVEEVEKLLKASTAKCESYELADKRMTSAKDVIDLKPDEDYERFLTGFTRLDQVTGGARLGELWLWAAYTGEYKSTSLLALGYELLIKGKNSFFVSFEMSAEEIKRKLICLHANRCFQIPLRYSQISSIRTSTDESMELYDKVAKDFEENWSGDMAIWEPPLGTTIEGLIKEYEIACQEKDYEVILIDYLQKVSPSTKRNQYRIEMTEVVDKAKRFATEVRNRMGAWIVSAWQVSRDGRKKAEEQGYYDLWALSESVGAEQAANVVIWTLATQKMRIAKEVKIGVAKSRNSSTANSIHYVSIDVDIGLIGQESIRDGVSSDQDSDEVISKDDLNILTDVD